MDESDLPVLIFRGGIHSDVLSLRVVRDANEIETSLETSALAGMGGSRLFVRKRDEVRAPALMDEFLWTGQGSNRNPQSNRRADSVSQSLPGSFRRSRLRPGRASRSQTRE